MGVFEFETPDGRAFEIDAPDAQSAVQAFRKNVSGPWTKYQNGQGGQPAPGPWTKYGRGSSRETPAPADISFDDLIPQRGGQPPSGGDISFDDLIPQNRIEQGFAAASSLPLRPDLAAAMDRRAHPGITRNVAAGLNNALYATAGAPVDAMTWALNKGIGGINAATGANLSEIQNPIGGSQSIANAFGTIGVDDPANVQANTTGERIARGVGEGIGYTVAPQAAVGALARGGALAPEAAAKAYNLLGWPSSTAVVAGNAVAGGAAGGGAVAAMEATADRYDPLSGLAGGMAGGAVGTLMTGVPRIAAQSARMAGEWAAPFSRGGRERLAGQTLQDAATNPSAAAAALEEPGVMVPGSQPTTFQQSGDMGLGALERRYSTMDPAAFNQRRADQNAARLDALGNIQPDGNPDAISRALRTRFAAIDQQTDAAVQAAMQTARTKTQGLGGSGSAEGYGDALRTSLRDAETKARDSERALWRAVDPEGKLALQTDNVRGTVGSIRKEMPETARPMEGEEAAIFDVAAKLKPAIGFNSMSALRSRVSTLMRQEMMTNGQSPAYSRLSRLRGAIEQDVEGVISRKAAEDAQAVASGAIREEDTMAAMLRRDQGAWYDRRAEEAGVGQNVGTGGGEDASLGPRAVPTARRGEVPSGRQLRDAARDPGVQSAPELIPNFDAAARSRLSAANDATKSRARTFGDGAMGSILRRSGNDGPYRLQNAAVPERLFFPGGKSAENINRFRQAVGDEQAMGHLQDYAVSQMRKAAETPEGIIDPKRLDAWRRRHGEALKAFPALNAKFADVEKASQAAIEAGTRRAQQLDDYQRGVVGRLIGAEHPEDVTRMVGSIFGRQDANAVMGQLVRQADGDKDALKGIRKAVVDHMLGRYVSNTEAATSGRSLLKADQLQTFLKENRGVLRRVFHDTEVERMEAVAADLQRANRSLSAVKLPGGSNTAQDTLEVARGDSGRTVLTKIILAAVAGRAAAGGLTGSALGILGANAVGMARRAGINTVDDLVRDALLNPDLAAILLTKRSFKPDTGPAVALAKRYRQAIASGVVTASGGEQETKPLHVEVTQPANRSDYRRTGTSLDDFTGPTYAEQLGLRR